MAPDIKEKLVSQSSVLPCLDVVSSLLRKCFEFLTRTRNVFFMLHSVNIIYFYYHNLTSRGGGGSQNFVVTHIEHFTDNAYYKKLFYYYYNGH